jgi:hypothetical protein
MFPELRPEAIDLIERVTTFINEDCKPMEKVFEDQIQVGEDRWNSYPSVIDDLKEKLDQKDFGIYFYLKVNLEQVFLTMNMLILLSKWVNAILHLKQ